MTPKLAGACSKCDVDVFKIVEHEPKPRKLGPPFENAMRATFQLVDGTKMDLTFCKDCVDSLQPHDFPFLWQRVMLTWETETPGHQNQKTHADNGILGLAHVVPWKDVK